MRIEITEERTAFPALEYKGKLICHFCLNEDAQLFHQYHHAGLNKLIYYCRSCISQGVHSGHFLKIEETDILQEDIPVQLPFQLTAQQQTASQFIVEQINRETTCLLYAVTGAGKTEMILEGITHVRRKGGNVAVVSPRTDVVKELSIRLTDYLQTDHMCTLYGGHSEITSHHLIISTIHQLIYFKHHFDLIIIDEIDAFPVGHDPRLTRLLERALTENGIFVYLSATPPKHILSACKDSTLYLPLRYHRRPLPVPKFKYLNHMSVVKRINKLFQQVRHPHVILIFFHHIELMEEAFARLDAAIKRKTVCVYSGDESRHEKVEAIREEAYQFVFTTTILERGFTMPHLSVWVINSHLFRSDSLIQIAGRVDRKGDTRNGEVLFFHDGISLSMIQAVKTIRKMNKRGNNVSQ